MKRYITIFILALCMAGSAYAQSSMTDKQIISYIQKQHEAGKDNETIAKELVAKSVPLERLRQLKDKYEKQAKNGNMVDLTEGTTAQQRMEDRSRGTSGVGQRAMGKDARRSMTKQRRLEYDEEQAGYLQNEINQFAPDSMQMYVEGLYQQPEETGKKVFGRDIFNNATLSFEPNENVATPSNYRLGAGDAIYIDVWGASQLSIQSTVSPDGTITVEGLGPVTVGGMTVASANAYLSRELQSIYQGSNVRVTVGQTKTIGINVMGEVVAPGTYTLSAFATAFHALYVAGGVNETGTLRDIRIYRSGRQVGSIDVYDYILHGKTGSDIRLEAGDVIYVGPYSALVDIEGKVKRPMFYEMKANETLGTLLGFAGKFTGDAYQKNIRVVRKSGYDYTIHTVEEFDFAAFKLMDGDSVTVDSIIPRFSNMVEVRGAVFRPGMYQMDGKTKTVRDLLTQIDGITEEAFRGRAIIYRMKEDRTREVKAFNLGEVMDGQAGDIPLKNEDIIYVFDQNAVKAGRTLTIYGSVMYPGVYEYAEGTSIEDIILQAGGLTDDASIQNVEVSRRIRNASAKEQGNQLTQTFSFTLNEDLSIPADPTFTLQPYDEVYVRRSPAWAEARNIVVDGEVNFTGTYTLRSKEERLSDIIKHAGGLTENAFVGGAHLERTMSDEEKERKKALIRLSQAAADSIDMTTLDISNTYSVGIDLEAALANPGGPADIIINGGDRLVVPEKQTLVKINGAVMYPNAIAWKKGKKASYYINQAGGYSSKAKKGSAFVVNMNGTVQKAKNAGALLPGSEIVVPTKSERRKLTTGEIVTIGTSTASLATMIATIVSLFRK